MNKTIINKWIPIWLAIFLFVLFEMRSCSSKKTDVVITKGTTTESSHTSSAPSTTTPDSQTTTTTETTEIVEGKKITAVKEPTIVKLNYPEFKGWTAELLNKDYVRYTWDSLKDPESADMIPCMSEVKIVTNTDTILDGIVHENGKTINLKLRYVKNLGTNQATYSKKCPETDWEDISLTEFSSLKAMFEKLRYLPVEGNPFDLRGHIDVPVTITRSWGTWLKDSVGWK